MRKLEVIALNAVDAQAAAKAGADRIELVSEMAVGGLSPSLETVKAVVAAVSIPVNVMIRQASSSFIYSQSEFDDLLAYLKAVKELGINGIVFGSLTSDNLVNEHQLQLIREAAGDLDFTFHRAIDECDQTYAQNFKLIDGQVTTVLTSGGTDQPLEDNIERLQAISNQQTRVLVGGGINLENYRLMFDSLPNCDFHIGSLAYNNRDFTAGINKSQVAEVKAYLNQ